MVLNLFSCLDLNTLPRCLFAVIGSKGVTKFFRLSYFNPLNQSTCPFIWTIDSTYADKQSPCSQAVWITPVENSWYRWSNNLNIYTVVHNNFNDSSNHVWLLSSTDTFSALTDLAMASCWQNNLAPTLIKGIAQCGIMRSSSDPTTGCRNELKTFDHAGLHIHPHLMPPRR